MSDTHGHLFDGMNRKDYIDLEPEAFPAPGEYDYVMLKYDGIWCRLTVNNCKGNYYSRNNQLKRSRTFDMRTLADDKGSSVLVGEYMYGQQWASHPDRLGKLFTFDALIVDGTDVTSRPFIRRHSEMHNYLRGKFEDINSIAVFGAEHAKAIWRNYVTNGHYEGIVFVKSRGNYADDIYARMKAEVTTDVYIIGYIEGTNRLKGSLGSCIVSDHRNGKRICEVGGGFDDTLRDEIWANRGEYLGRCMTVKANKRFSSGALRSPNFVSWHLEK